MSRLAAFFASMAGRIFLVLLLGVAVSASLALGLADFKRRADLNRLHLERAADRTQDFVSTLNNTSEPVRGRLAAKGARGVRPAPAGPDDGKTDPEFTALLATRLGSKAQVRAASADLAICARSWGRDGARFTQQAASDRNELPPGVEPPQCWIVTLKLDDGTPLRLAVDTPPRLVGESRAFDPIYLAILAAGVCIMALIVARMAAAPLRNLAEAADDLGRDLNHAPLVEGGPTEVAAAASAFNSMQTQLQEHVAGRTQMLAAITHDLQTPLTRLRLRLEKVTDPALKARLVADLAAMQDLVREGLDLARSQQTVEAVARVDLDSLLESLVADAVDAGETARLAKGAGADVRARPQALRRCISNLIDNALTYGGDAEVSASAERDTVVVRVRDHGPGLPPDKLEAVFDPFMRLEDSRSRETGGSGLGLTIARALAERNGGSLTLRNHPEGGLEAVLTLQAI
ncbi:ATP-binding protein [Phenylobacterium sp.]|uniref:ATP-binding protein n=1 Tax=Phenylobacterium sp. TaxID=1871053 RepID=UPI0035B36F56